MDPGDPLNPAKAREEPLRIAPVRRKTLMADQWGIHNVPTMLNDFKRHTSHAGLALNTNLNSRDFDRDGGVSPGPYSAIPEDKQSLLLSIPALIALPTGLLGADYLAATTHAPIITVLLVSGFLLVMSGLFNLLDSRSTRASSYAEKKNSVIMVLGIIGLVTSSSTLGSTKTTIFSMIALNVNSRPTLKTAWPYLLFLVVMLTYDLGKMTAPMEDLEELGDEVRHIPILHSGPIATIIGYIALAGSCYTVATPNPNTISVGVVAGSGIALLTPGILIARPNLNTCILVVITSWAIGVFLLAKRQIWPSRFNPVVGATIITGLESMLRDTTPWAIILSAVTLLMPVAHKKAAIAVATSEEGTTAWGIVDSILAHDDTRNIFYFLLLNFTFMLIQLLYSLLSHSLGLLSDSIHMFFDCVALLVGLVASILSKFPPSTRFPYGLGKVETVSGFANGCLLIGISGGVITEAFERIYHPVELEKTAELLVVSVLGLLVNLVGIFAFHHGHGHGHSHGGSDHGHSHEHSHSHSHSTESHSHSHSHSTSTDDHKNENMYGIFLHIMADTLGSVGVIASTLLIKYTGWPGFDPLASIFISVLIFLSAIPLITSSATTLLLSLSYDQEYHLRDILNEISITSGVSSYTVPKFWADGSKVRGVIHVQYHQDANSTVVRDKVENKLKEHGIDGIFIQVEREGTPCWCQESRFNIK